VACVLFAPNASTAGRTGIKLQILQNSTCHLAPGGGTIRVFGSTKTRRFSSLDTC
jgi:hypothetical protein